MQQGCMGARARQGHPDRALAPLDPRLPAAGRHATIQALKKKTRPPTTQHASAPSTRLQLLLEIELLGPLLAHRRPQVQLLALRVLRRTFEGRSRGERGGEPAWKQPWRRTCIRCWAPARRPRACAAPRRRRRRQRYVALHWCKAAQNGGARRGMHAQERQERQRPAHSRGASAGAARLNWASLARQTGPAGRSAAPGNR